jgi:hypothetical protein
MNTDYKPDEKQALLQNIFWVVTEYRSTRGSAAILTSFFATGQLQIVHSCCCCVAIYSRRAKHSYQGLRKFVGDFFFKARVSSLGIFLELVNRHSHTWAHAHSYERTHTLSLWAPPKNWIRSINLEIDEEHIYLAVDRHVAYHWKK